MKADLPATPSRIFHILYPISAAGMIGCIEEVAYYSKFIDKEQLLKLAEKLEKSGYGEYLRRVAENIS